MAPNAPSKIYFNYLAKQAIRDLERKNQRADSALSRKGGARSKQWALLRKVGKRAVGGGRKKGNKVKKGARKKSRARGGKRPVKRRGGGKAKKRGARKRKRGRPKKSLMKAGRKKGARKKAGARRKGGAKTGAQRKRGGKRKRKSRRKALGNMESYQAPNPSGKPHQQMTGLLRASYPSPNALRTLSSQAFSDLQKTGLQRMSPLEIYKQRL